MRISDQFDEVSPTPFRWRLFALALVMGALIIMGLMTVEPTPQCVRLADVVPLILRVAVSGAHKRKRRREALWQKQKGRCFWCKNPMLRWDDPEYVKTKRGKLPLNLATIDHLRPRHHPLRLEPNTGREKRWVLACWKCNNDRDREAVMAMPIEERWLAARAFPKNVPQPHFVRKAIRNGN